MNTDPRDEFAEFVSERESPQLPRDVQISMLRELKRRVEPSLSDVLPKFIFAQLAAALATLSICPQFGVGPITSGHGIGHLFMRFGEAGCAAFCGSFFLATGTLVAALILRKGERREIMRYRFRILAAVSMVTFLIFMGVGKSLELPMIFNSTVAYISWLVGALVSSLIILQLIKSFGGLTKT